MTMQERLRIHRAVEAADREHRIWYRNTQMLDRFYATFPIGRMVENFGVTAEVVGYQVRGMSYTGDLILQEPETGLRWIGNPEYCTAIA